MAGTTRHFRWLRDELPLVAVTLVLLSSVAYLLVWPDHWRRGVGLIALAAVLAGGLRLVLPESRAGALVVRKHRLWDATCYLVPGVVILVVEIRLH